MKDDHLEMRLALQAQEEMTELRKTAIMTELEAKSKWCAMAHPLADYAGMNPAKYNRGTNCNCIASDCMMWRWDGLVQRICRNTRTGNDEVEPPRPADVPESWTFCPVDMDPSCWVEPEEEAAKRRQGFCGLAGKR